jgi:hypothetical protein
VDGRPAERKLWARLRNAGLRRASEPVRRLMRENGLLSPHRTRPRPDGAHERSIITDAPNVMWAPDGTQIGTVRSRSAPCATASSGSSPRSSTGTRGPYVSHPGRSYGCFLNSCGLSLCHSFIAGKGDVLPKPNCGSCWL